MRARWVYGKSPGKMIYKPKTGTRYAFWAAVVVPTFGKCGRTCRSSAPRRLDIAGLHPEPKASAACTKSRPTILVTPSHSTLKRRVACVHDSPPWARALLFRMRCGQNSVIESRQAEKVRPQNVKGWLRSLKLRFAPVGRVRHRAEPSIGFGHRFGQRLPV